MYHVSVMYAHDSCLLPCSAIWNHQCKSTKSLKVTSLAECDLGFNLSYTSHNSISNDRRGPLFWEMTLPETNIFAPEKGLPKWKLHLPTIDFQGLLLLVSGKVHVLVGGFNPSENMLVRLKHFPK